MKKNNIFLSMLGIFLILVSCSRNLDEIKPPSPVKEPGTVTTNHFYGTIASDQPGTKGVAQLDKVWRAGTTIKVKLLNDPYNMAEEIKAAAIEWEEHANIKFRFVESNETAHVRIGFDWNENRWITWSYTGTDCKIATNQNDATMSFAFFDILSAEERRGDILRAFGQVLGLELEHRHLDFDAGWTKYISQYWEGEIEDIPWDELKKYVFDPLEAENVMQTDEYDANSIMIWPFSRKYATNTARDFNNKLSEKDKEFIDKLYPGKEKAMITIGIEGSYGIGFRITSSSDVIIDWGDGEVITYPPTDEYITKLFPDQTAREIKFYGDPAAVTGIFIDKDGTDEKNKLITNINLSKCVNLEGLYINYWKFNNIDLSNCVKLKHLGLGVDKLTHLDLSNCKELEDLSVISQSLASLDISNCTKLKYLTLGNTKLISLDKSNFVNLNSLILHYNSNLAYLDVSGCINLDFLDCRVNNLAYLDVSGCINLNSLLCESTNLENLNVSGCINLNGLNCSDNNLTSLDVSGCINLSYLKCDNNNLTSLDVSGLTKLYSLNVSKNPLCFDESEMKMIANQIVDRNDSSLGRFYTNNHTQVSEWNGDILTSKNWSIYSQY